MKELVKIKNFVEERRKVQYWVDFLRLENYTINEDLTVDVDDNLFLANNFKNITELPIQFGVVTGNVWAQNSKFTTLKGFPHTVGKWFTCHGNDLTNLDFVPKNIGGCFSCSKNKLTTMEGCPIPDEDIFCGENELKTLEHLPKQPQDLYKYYGNPCTPIYQSLGWTEKAHKQCRKVWI